jgi:hypothetical protein
VHEPIHAVRLLVVLFICVGLLAYWLTRLPLTIVHAWAVAATLALLAAVAALLFWRRE